MTTTIASTLRDGTPTRWRFTEITQHSFHWIGDSLNPDGQSWKLEGEFRAKRMQGGFSQE